MSKKFSVQEMMQRELETWNRIADLIENQTKVMATLVAEKHEQNELKRRELELLEENYSDEYICEAEQGAGDPTE